MAYLQDDEENQAQGLNQTLTGAPAPQPEEQQPAAPAQNSTQSTAPTTSTPSTPSTQPNVKAGSGSFTNLKSYLTANQGNRISGAASQKVSNLATGAQKGITQASTAFGQQLEKGTLANRGQALQDVTKTVAGARGVAAQQPTSAMNVAPNPQPVAPAPTQQAQAVTAEPAPQPAPISVQQPRYIDDEQATRFADIINARYSGPESIRQAGLLQPAQSRVQEATRQAQNVQTAGGREELLRSMFGKNRDYTQGQSKLDALLLNTSQQGVGQLKQAATGAQNLTQQLQKAENISQNEAQNRAAEIAGIRGQARDIFGRERTAEETGTEQRISSLIETPVMDANGQPVLKQDGTPMTEWDRLPEHFRQSLTNKAQGAKAAQSEALAKTQTQYAPQLQAVTQASKAAADLQKQYDNAIRQQEMMRMGIVFGNSSNTPAEENQRIANTIQSLGQQLQQANQASQTAQTSPEYQQYLKDKATAEGMNLNQWVMSPEEAAILGVSTGEGLYNMRPEDIRTAQADREKLITQDEFARQQALSQLAGLDLSKGLQKELKYKDQAKAGTQSLLSSLDTEAFRRQLEEGQGLFRESAEGANITGVGKKKVSRGNAFGKKTKTYHANVKGNVADMLKQAGIDLDTLDEGQAQSILGNKELVQRIAAGELRPMTAGAAVPTDAQALSSGPRGTDTERLEEGNVGFNATEGAVAGAGTGASIGTAINPGFGTAVGAAIGGTVGGMAGANTLDQMQMQTDLAKELEEKYGIKGVGAAGQAVQDVRSGIGGIYSGIGNMAGKNVVGDIYRGIGGAVGGINTGAMKAMGSAVAKQKAIQDLQKKYTEYLKGQGFENRVNIADTDTTSARTQALRDLLSRKG